ncbi:M3 family oligoendopeptidase [Chengkuizengella axinellae]|uniref:M3 family oligoendopeptidase n=1 Tax=Chengkuizengella axinellae TaxID=3064388 RepID=A0ABT9J296_9BACL|nr:M3 family oligoendopeptidase [Chengkuizengella sp. 2205SS18-9]MDP5275731.1 M3 family oligoendopeptidase [Chengkuizengella sp. 2205SS18-9]
MKFSEFTYTRPNMEEISSQFEKVLMQFTGSNSADEQNAAMKAIYTIYNDVYTMFHIASIRHSINTKDQYYKSEQEYMDEAMPVFNELFSKFYKALIESKYRDELDKKWGSHLFDLAELEIKTMSPEIVEDLQQENKFSSRYSELIASAEINFDGKTYTLAQLFPFTQSDDRETRKRANEAKYTFFSENEAELDQLYDNLVSIRTKIAKKLGYNNFVELSYARLKRTEYGAEQVAAFRDQVHQYIVPIATQLKKRQQERLGLDNLKYYDENYDFKSGNAKPKGDPDWIVANGQTMYEQLSKETDEFYCFMKNGELMDLLSRDGKMAGGYCSFLPNYKSPYIFANFNGTSGDVDVLTHEAGHAFQVYSSRHFENPEYTWPTYEACEIHSMSMEFFAWPWMELFFQGDTDKYKFSHLSKDTMFIPYGVAVDEFQHFVYEHPEATPKERKLMWREIEKKYLPHRDYDGNEYLEQGGFWYQQGHIFEVPFYYIDYTLALICAFQFWKKMNEDRDQAWEDYTHLCKIGGSKPFLELVKEAKLSSPFEEGTVQSVINEIELWLNNIDDTAL